MMPAKFPLGKVCCTLGAAQEFDRAGVSHYALVCRHQNGDWGETDPEDWRRNEEALAEGGGLFSSYFLPSGANVWIVTESSRTLTTVMLPDEY